MSCFQASEGLCINKDELMEAEDGGWLGEETDHVGELVTQEGGGMPIVDSPPGWLSSTWMEGKKNITNDLFNKTLFVFFFNEDIKLILHF